MNSPDAPYLTVLKLTSPALAGGGDAFLGTMVTSDGTEFEVLFASIASLRVFLREMTPESIELDCLPGERLKLEQAIREHPLLH